MNRTAQPSLLSVHDANGTPLARLGTLSPLSFHPTLVHHCTRLSRPATPCGALPLVRLCIICGAVGCQVAVTYSPFSVADGPRRVPRAVSEFPEIHVSVAILSGIMPMFCGRSGIRTRDVLRFLRRLYVALSVQQLIPSRCLRPLSHPSVPVQCAAVSPQHPPLLHLQPFDPAVIHHLLNLMQRIEPAARVVIPLEVIPLHPCPIEA